jgi:hypothetical protein
MRHIIMVIRRIAEASASNFILYPHILAIGTVDRDIIGTIAASLSVRTRLDRDTKFQPGKVREDGMKEYKIHEHHEEAAQRYEQAAKHHREAAKHHKAGDHVQAAHHARIAFGHYLEAAEHQNNAARRHAKMHS